MSDYERFYPPVDPERAAFEAPVAAVTLLEDRAQIRREGVAKLGVGRTRLLVMDVAPTIQDVSLIADVAGGTKVADVRVRRALKVQTSDKPETAQRLEEQMDTLRRQFRELEDDRTHAEGRQGRVIDLLEMGIQEIPEDAAWGIVNPKAWAETFETLFKKSRTLTQESIQLFHQQEDAHRDWSRLFRERQVFDEPSMQFFAWLEIDLESDAASEVRVAFEYVVPNAIWRPMHRATLETGQIEFESNAVVWQNTGEDWTDVEMTFSTARSSLGTEPPVLHDDLVEAQKKSDEVIVEARQVTVQKAGLGGGGGPATSRGVDLPGVDDGGETQNLRSESRVTVPSTGRPNIVPLSRFVAESRQTLVSMPELDQKVFLKSEQANESGAPLLAGPVELIKDHGAVGWTKVLYVAPGERFELGFGPDEAMRVVRASEQASQTDSIDKWSVTVHLTQVYLSNLGRDPKRVEVLERIPLSEIEQVRVTLLEDATTSGFAADEHGFCKWSCELEPYARTKVRLAWSLATAPGVTGV